MKNQFPSYWANRFEALLDTEALKQRAMVTAPPLTNLASLPTELACHQLEAALATVFYPTTQCVSILKRLIGVAYAHCLAQYPDGKTFLQGLYAPDAPFPDFSPPICLTGLAGTGKTELIKAFCRIYGNDGQVMVDESHSPFPIKGPWMITVHARSSPMDIFSSLIQTKGRLADLIIKCRRLAYRDGVPFLIGDEFQFTSGSESANTRVAQMLLSLGYIGLPFVFVGNYSLIRRLQRRPGEEQQRLLASPIIVFPDSAESLDWQETLKVQCDVAPDILVFDPIRDAEALHAYSAGRKRAMAKLLILAFSREHPHGGKVTLGAIHRAYHASEYAVYREETEILTTQAIQNRPNEKRKDLWCPIPLPRNTATTFLDSSIEASAERMAEAELTAALTYEERQHLSEIKRNILKGEW
ncbi:hypothetical protein [Noviherbaspirillum cavernae]|uniref:hypothetical protein n=1 Tax=Noviherbaspirillum cavernae TaxID=2320862 RepID=UPI0011C4846C|nr:hypothetical protein [Noviherbaspirillum cavernae]